MVNMVADEMQQRINALVAESKEWEQDIDKKPLELLTHEEYLQTQLWKHIIKPRVLKRDSKLCRRCGGTATLVHHRSYAAKVMAGNDDEQLASICEGCHEVIHFDDSGVDRVKRTPVETDRLLLEGISDVSFPAPKYDLRKDKEEHPPEWSRMSAVQRTAWEQEYDRLRCLRKLKKNINDPGWTSHLRQRLRERHGMDEVAIDGALALRRRG